LYTCRRYTETYPGTYASAHAQTHPPRKIHACCKLTGDSPTHQPWSCFKWLSASRNVNYTTHFSETSEETHHSHSALGRANGRTTFISHPVSGCRRCVPSVVQARFRLESFTFGESLNIDRYRLPMACNLRHNGPHNISSNSCDYITA
jgi:hypothetical protein